VLINSSPGSGFSGDSLGSTGTIALSATGSAEGFFADAAAVVFFDATGLSIFPEPGALGTGGPPEAGVAAVEGGTGVPVGVSVPGVADASPEAGVAAGSVAGGGGVSG